MPNKELGIADPVYDALRIRSGQSIAPDLGGGSTGTGGGLENKIYVWHSDGSTIDTFDPDATGLGFAITAAAAGDTIWLPSIPIALTAAITIPASVTLTGISHDAILTFTGFAGAAIVMSANSIIEGFTVSHTDGVGFDASVSGAKVINMIVTANPPGEAGLDVVVAELWIYVTGASENIVAWSDYEHGGTRVWTSVASIPAGTAEDMAVADDGSCIYLKVSQAIYQCSNPKAVSPTWTSIAAVGTVTGIGTITDWFGYQLGPMRIYGTTLVTTASVGGGAWVYGEYNGTAWTWTSEGSGGGFRPTTVGLDTWTVDGVNVYDRNHSLIEALPAGTATDCTVWHRTGAARYIPTTTAGVTRVALRILTVGDIDLGAYDNSSQVQATKVRGAHQGIQVYCVNDAVGADSGGIWLSDNGTSFSKIATWFPSFVEDDRLIGGGDLIVFRLFAPASSEIGREYSRAGAVVDNLTGNFWSLVTNQNKFILAFGIVYG